jgi:hypothetical protein
VRVDGALSRAGVAGDPDMVSAAATRFGQTAELIASAAEGLHHLDAEAAQSDAIAAFLAKAGEIEAQLRQVHRRYVGASDALRTYATALRHAQEQAGPAVREHEAAVVDRDAATVLADRYEGMALLATSEEAQLDYQELARVQRLREEEASGRVVKHGRQVDDAVTDLEAAATTTSAPTASATRGGTTSAGPQAPPTTPSGRGWRRTTRGSTASPPGQTVWGWRWGWPPWCSRPWRRSRQPLWSSRSP